MIIVHIYTKPISYTLNPLFAVSEETQFDWTIGFSHDFTNGNALAYGLTLEWTVSHQDKDTAERLVECRIRFRMDFDVESETWDCKDLAAYLCDTLSQVQAIISVGVPEQFGLLKPVALDYHGHARAVIRDIIRHGCYT
jgi:hypothetical protein